MTSVRIPGWVDRGAVRCEINGNPTTPFWIGRYIFFQGCNGHHAIRIQFPVVETTETYENPFQGVGIPGHTEVTSSLGKPPQKLTPYTFRVRGNTLVEISPRDDESLGYPIYVRDQMKTTRAPMKNRSRYVATRLI